ncbi:MAG: DUF1538 domain-containing protein [Treponema sp.]|nr:DUF1538 domain-containing protein [Treponema sp.]
MNILEKLKETAISVLPVMAIVLILGNFLVPMDKIVLTKFVIGGILLILGLTIFLLGVDLGIQPMGERCGSALTQKRSLGLLLSVAFVIGFIVTAAEPDIQVFGDQVKSIFPQVNKSLFTFSIAAGVGLFIMLGLLRSVLNFSIKWTLLAAYIFLFVISFFAPENFIGIAFDSGGATTGPMTVPFILALGLGVSSVRSKDNDNSFGLTGIASIGPILAVLIYSIILSASGSFSGNEEIGQGIIENQALAQELIKSSFFKEVFQPFGQVFSSVFKEALISIAPLFGLFIIFQIFLLKMTVRQVVRMIIGFIYSLIGLTIFLIGVNGGFMQAGKILGQLLGSYAVNRGGIWYAILIATGFILGAIIVCAEPAVWVLSEQVESVSGGTIKRKFLLLFLSVGTALAIGLSLLRCIWAFDLKWVLIPGYSLALLLMIFSPDLFTGVAFDSGGVASGPLTSTFILSFTIGASNKGGDSFGVIALVAMMPLITIQLMGIVFNKKMISKNKTNPEIEGEADA